MRGPGTRDLAGELAVLFALVATRASERVGALLFSDTTEECLWPHRTGGRPRAIAEWFASHAPSGRTSVARACARAHDMLRQPGTVVIISDFFDEGYARDLRVLASKHDVLGVAVVDPQSATLPRAGLVRLEDPESGRARVVDTLSPKVREEYERHWRQWQQARVDAFGEAGLPCITVPVGQEYLPSLLRVFRRQTRGR